MVGHDIEIVGARCVPQAFYILFIFPLAPGRIELIRLRNDIPALELSEARMLDAIFIAAGLAFFAVAIGYTLICEKL